MREVALPILKEFGYPGILFVPTDFIGGHNSFDADEEPNEPICDWEDLRELERHGISVQSHGAAHRAFSEIDVVQQEHELVQSKKTLQAGLGTNVEIFSFPYGDNGGHPQLVAGLLEHCHYRAACLYDGLLNELPVKTPYQLSRLTIGPDSDLEALLTPNEPK
jgi:peptidoglycan/xylan/chitin deacetylase (PgdA/CDA1 family)